MQEASVDVWTVPLTQPRALILNADEAARAARFRFEDDRIRWSRSRSALRSILATYVGRNAGALEFVYGTNGKPGLAGSGIEFNLSHAGDFALIAVSKVAPVGVDIEKIREKIGIADLLRRLGETDLPEDIPALYARWTLREAKTKAAGGQLFVPTSADVCAINLSAPDGYSAAVALVGFRPVVNTR